MSDSGSERKMTEQELVSYFFDAVNYGHIYNVYQPKMNHSTGRMIGAEALMRMKHPLYGLQMPSDFIPVFEKNDMVFSADLVVCENVCKFLRKCIDEGIPVVPISVNSSTTVGMFRRASSKYGCAFASRSSMSASRTGTARREQEPRTPRDRAASSPARQNAPPNEK